MRLKDYANKWWLWSNGLRFKVTDKVNEYGDWIAENAEGRQWPIRPQSMKNATEITEEQAKLQYVNIESSLCYEGFCSCCSWKNGKEQMRLKMKLAQGKSPADECSRIETELRTFFNRQGVFNILPYVRRSEDGIEFQFISRKSHELEPVGELS